MSDFEPKLDALDHSCIGASRIWLRGGAANEHFDEAFYDVTQNLVFFGPLLLMSRFSRLRMIPPSKMT